jgi:dienelactone hydrolase
VITTAIATAAGCASSSASGSSASPLSQRARPPRLTPVAAPRNVHDDRVHWYEYPAGARTRVSFGVVRGTGRGPRPAVVVLPGGDGFSTDHVAFAEGLARRGFDVGFGCWWANVPVPANGPTDGYIACPDGPRFKGVADGAVADVDALVAGVRRALHGPAELALLGFSRGAGIAVLRASQGRTEPVVAVSGMFEGASNLGVFPGEVDVVTRAASIRAPVLVLHATGDDVVPVGQARDFEAALRASGTSVEATYYDVTTHGIEHVPWVRDDIIERTAVFLCVQFHC